MKNKILMLLMFIIINNTSNAECNLYIHSIYEHYLQLVPKIKINYNRTSPTLTHIITSNTLWFDKENWIQEQYGDCKYEFDWNETFVSASFWMGLYETDQPENQSFTKYVCTGITFNADYENINFIRFDNDTLLYLPFDYLKSQGISFRYSYSDYNIKLVSPFTKITPSILQNISNFNKRYGNFIENIWMNTALINKLKKASSVKDSSDTLRFATGIGFVDSIGFKDAFDEYGIDKDRPIFYIITHHKSEYDWEFYYNYADTDIIDTVYYFSSTSGIIDSSASFTSKLYPNPTDATFTLTLYLQKAGILYISLNNILEQEIFELHNIFADIGTFTKTFSIENLPQGIYYLKIIYNGNTKVEKVIKI